MNCRHCGQRLGIIERWRLGHFCSKECRSAFTEEEARLTEQIVEELRRRGERPLDAAAAPEPLPEGDSALCRFQPEPASRPARINVSILGIVPAAPVTGQGARGAWKELAYVAEERASGGIQQTGESRLLARAIRAESGLPPPPQGGYELPEKRPVLAPDLRARRKRPKLRAPGLGIPVEPEFSALEWRLPEHVATLECPWPGSAVPALAGDRSGLSAQAAQRVLEEHPGKLPVEQPLVEPEVIDAGQRLLGWPFALVEATPLWAPGAVPLNGLVFMVALMPLEPRLFTPTAPGGIFQPPVMGYPPGYMQPTIVPGMGAVLPAGMALPANLLNQLASLAMAGRAAAPAVAPGPPPGYQVVPNFVPATAAEPMVSVPLSQAGGPVVIPVIPAWAQALSGMGGGSLFPSVGPSSPTRRRAASPPPHPPKPAGLPPAAPVMSLADVIPVPEFAPAILPWPEPADPEPAYEMLRRRSPQVLPPRKQRPALPWAGQRVTRPGWSLRRAAVERPASMRVTPAAPHSPAAPALPSFKPVALPMAITQPRWRAAQPRPGWTLRRPPVHVRLNAVAAPVLEVPPAVRRMAG